MIRFWRSSKRLYSICPETLEDLTDMAVKIFSPILNRGLDPAPIIPEHPFGKDEQGVRRLLVNIIFVSV